MLPEELTADLRQLAAELARDALRVAGRGLLLGLVGGAAVGWLFTSGTRAAMANWGLPASFVMPVRPLVLGAIGALAFALAVAVPTALALVGRSLPGRRL